MNVVLIDPNAKAKAGGSLEGTAGLGMRRPNFFCD